MPLKSPDISAFSERLYSWRWSAFLPVSPCLSAAGTASYALYMFENFVLPPVEGMEKSVLVGSRGVAGIDMKPEFSLAERADRLPVDLDVAHEQHLLVV